jgi:hypothetical protein
MTITPTNVASIAASIQDLLQKWPGLQDVTITRGEFVNQNPDSAPWIGIYPLGIQYPIRSLGLGSGFRKQQISFAVVTQAQTAPSDDGGASCMDALEDLNQKVISCILSNDSLGGFVTALDNFSVQYASAKTQADDPNFQSSIITFTGEKSVSGG